MTDRRITIPSAEKHPLHQFLDFLRETVEQKRLDAMLVSAMGDYSADRLEEQINVYEAAMRNTTPKCWDHYVKEFNRKADPEYQTYIRLKEKFGE